MKRSSRCSERWPPGCSSGRPLIRANIQASFNTQYDMLKPIDEHFALIGVIDEKKPGLAQAA